MNLKQTLYVVKFSSLAFASLAVVYGVKYYDNQKKISNLQKQINLDKSTYTNDLREIFNRYDNEKEKNEILLQNISEPVNKSKLKNPIAKDLLNTQINTHLQQKYDSILLMLNDREEENNILLKEVSQLTEKNSELEKINSTNKNIIAHSKNLTAVNVVANGIKIVSNNIIETKKFICMEQIKVCFTLLENRATVKGNKDIYIQILNPKNKIVSINNETIEKEDRTLQFSAKTNVFYDNEEMDVCVFVDPNKNDIMKGDYEINIFSGIHQIGSTVFTLK